MVAEAIPRADETLLDEGGVGARVAKQRAGARNRSEVRGTKN